MSAQSCATAGSMNNRDKGVAQRAMDAMLKMKKIDIAAIERAAAGAKTAA
jgi:transcriptional regulator